MDSKAAIVAILERLRKAFHPVPDIDADTLRIYRDSLTEFDPKVLQAAAVLLAKTCRWWPSIAQIRSACLEVSGKRAKLPGVGEAYAEARRGAARFGAYTKPAGEDFSSALVHRAAIQAAGSWRRWCLSEDEAPLRARFFDVYRELRDRELTQQALPSSARQLTAEESRQLLEDVNARAQREAPRITAENQGEELKPVRELLRSNPPVVIPREDGVVGKNLSETEFAERKASVIESARVHS